MRLAGVDEELITGKGDEREKFRAYAKTLETAIGNPLYHWTHLELQRYFNVHDVLSEQNAREIYETCTAQLQTPEFSVRPLLRRMNVETVCTTDDPLDSLEYHQQIKQDGLEIKVLPAFRPDKAMQVEDAAAFNSYLNRLEAASNTAIHSFND